MAEHHLELSHGKLLIYMVFLQNAQLFLNPYQPLRSFPLPTYTMCKLTHTHTHTHTHTRYQAVKQTDRSND